MASTARAPATAARVAVVLALLAAPAQPATTAFWSTAGFQEFASGEAEGTSVRADGSVVLAPSFEALETEPAGYAWAATRGPDGAIYAVTGTPGALIRVDGSGPETLLSMETADLPALAVAPDGRVFVGSAPGGVVSVVTPGGGSEVYFETGEGYIWCMDYSPVHGLIVGTGEAARVYSVRGPGEGEMVFESSEASITAVAVAGGRVYAGTAGQGLLVDITPGERPRVLYDSPYEEITGIAVASSGSVWFTASSILFEDVLDDRDDNGATFGDGSVYNMDGGVTELWEAIGVPLTCIGLAGDEVLVGTGSSGEIHRIDRAGGRDLVGSLDAEEILAIAAVDEEVLVATGRPGGVYLATSARGEKGTLVSTSYDAGSGARWGGLEVRAETPAGSRVLAETRSGNIEEPDETWSEWSPVEGGLSGGIESPPARFVQWRLTLEAGRDDVTPVVREVRLSSRTENRPPRVTAVVVHGPADAGAVTGPGLGGGMVSQKLPGGLEVTYTSQEPLGSENLAALVRGHRTAEWQADDPDGDRLRFNLFLGVEGADAWTLLAEEVESTAYTWDTTSMPDGDYVLRVVASDGIDNAADESAVGERRSAPFLVDLSPPELGRFEVKVKDGSLVVSGSVEDARSPIVSVDIALDYGDWKTASALDGLMDSRSEAYRGVLETTAGGPHVVAVRAVDRAGNVGVGRRVLK